MGPAAWWLLSECDSFCISSVAVRGRAGSGLWTFATSLFGRLRLPIVGAYLSTPASFIIAQVELQRVTESLQKTCHGYLVRTHDIICQVAAVPKGPHSAVDVG